MRLARLHAANLHALGLQDDQHGRAGWREIAAVQRAIPRSRRALATLVAAHEVTPTHLLRLPDATIDAARSAIEVLDAVVAKLAEDRGTKRPAHGRGATDVTWRREFLRAVRLDEDVARNICDHCASLALAAFCGKNRHGHDETAADVRRALGKMGLAPFPNEVPTSLR
jgi:hypothetical protein